MRTIRILNMDTCTSSGDARARACAHAYPGGGTGAGAGANIHGHNIEANKQITQNKLQSCARNLGEWRNLLKL